MSTDRELEYQYRQNRYDSFVHERDALRNCSLEVSGRYDKWILGIAGGALALSVTFIEKIANNPNIPSLIILGISWLLLISSVALEMYALATSQTAINEEIEQLEKDYENYLLSLNEGSSYQLQREENVYSKRTRSFNTWSLRTLVLGILLICIFALINLPMAQ